MVGFSSESEEEADAPRNRKSRRQSEKYPPKGTKVNAGVFVSDSAAGRAQCKLLLGSLARKVREGNWPDAESVLEAQASRTGDPKHPKAKERFENEEIALCHLVLLAAKITEANSEVLLKGIKGTSKREAEAFVSRVSFGGEVSEGESRIDVNMKLTPSQMEALDRAREVMSAGSRVPTVEEIVMEALEALLDKNDPLRKAERAEKRKQAAPGQGMPRNREMKKVPSPGKEQKTSRPAIPAAIQHTVWMRDKAQCTWILGDKNRCPEKGMLELDHLKPWAWGGEHSVENLALRCRRHNPFRARGR